jgi:hypothetical protein
MSEENTIPAAAPYGGKINIDSVLKMAAQRAAGGTYPTDERNIFSFDLCQFNFQLIHAIRDLQEKAASSEPPVQIGFSRLECEDPRCTAIAIGEVGHPQGMKMAIRVSSNHCYSIQYLNTGLGFEIPFSEKGQPYDAKPIIESVSRFFLAQHFIPRPPQDPSAKPKPPANTNG